MVVRVASHPESRVPLELPKSWRCTVTGAVPSSATEEQYDAVLLDARGASEAEAEQQAAAVRASLRAMPGTRLVALVSDPCGPLASAAVQAGVWDVVGADALDRIAARLADAARLRRLHPLTPPADASEESVEAGEPREMIGTSATIRGVFALIRRVAASDIPVLIVGESGTGKELAALAIHERSRRGDKPFVPINCGAIPEALLESELFGYEKGAFTGAAHLRKGRLETADGGTIFLDEIGELAPLLQVKLLRFLEDHIVERVGGRSGIPLDVRVIAATNRDLASMVEAAAFREDLYFRLAVLPISMPPLRERDDDVFVMARFFLSRYARESGRSFRGFSRSAIDAILQHPWPGNVRELINRVRRAVVIADGPFIEPAHLGLEPVLPLSTPVLTLRDARREAELRSLRMALLRANGNKAEAAKLLGISRTQLYELMARHHLPTHDAARV